MSRRRAIEESLIAYHQTPGKYALTRRQPALLYNSVKDILQLASGRATDGTGAAPPGHAVQLAATFFIRSAMLHPDASHYALLGLQRDAGVGELKDRYRMMMRLTHPDFASSMADTPWPADAATRVNRAYEILSSPMERRGYDEELEPTAPASLDQAGPRTSPGRLAAARGDALPKRRHEDNRRDLRRLSTVFGVVGGVALVAAGIALTQPDKESLVQRVRGMAPRALPPSAQVIEAASITDVPAALSSSPLPEAGPGDAPARIAPARPPESARVGGLASFAHLSTGNSSGARSGMAPVAMAPVALSAPAPSDPAVSVEPTPLPTLATALTPPGPATASPPAQAPMRAQPYTGPTLADVHPMLSRLLQEIESGFGDRMMGLVEREARSAPAGQALVQHYNSLVDGMRPVKVSNVQFSAQPRDGRLLVTGHLTMQTRAGGVASREFAVQAEFASRDGSVVMTRLVRAD